MVGGAPKPFPCTNEGCTMTFTNEDHLSVHQKKHEMVLMLGSKSNIVVADQTPTPTRFLRNCEEVGLFQDLQNVNPFEETFRRAVELVKTGSLPEPDLPEDDTLHTPHVFPHLPEENGIYSSQNCNNIKDDDKLSLNPNDDTVERNIDLTVQDDKELISIENVKLLASEKSPLLLNTDNLNKIHDHIYTSFIDPKENNEEPKTIGKQLTIRERKNSTPKNKKLIKDTTNAKQTTNIAASKFKLQQALLKNKKQMRSNDNTKYNPSIILNPIKIAPADTILQSAVPSISIINTTIPVLQKIQKVSILPNEFIDVSQLKIHSVNEQITLTNTNSEGNKEKRKELLERNRAAATRCRVKKKMWIETLSNKFDLVCQENDVLHKENMALRNEIMQLKTLLLAHKECSVTKAMNMGQNIPIGPAQILHVKVPTTEPKKTTKNNSSESLNRDREAKIPKLHTNTLPEIVKDVTKKSVIVINSTYNNINVLGI